MTGSRAAIASEARSLEWLAGAGGAAVVPLLEVTPHWLETRRLTERHATPDAAERFGRELARTHAAGADWFGQGSPGLDPSDSVLADLPHPVRTRPGEGTPRGASGAGERTPSGIREGEGGGTQPTDSRGWGEFYATLPVEPYVRIAVDGGNLGGEDLRATRRAMERLAAGEFDHPLPGLCGGPARLHGDLWGGNVLWTVDHPDRGGVLTGVLIDPAAHGGHAETDLAELALFGSPQLQRTVAAYYDASPLATGSRERVALQQLHMLAVHAAKFGGGYGASLGRAAARYQ